MTHPVLLALPALALAPMAIAEAPQTLDMAVIVAAGAESAWDSTFLQDLEALKEVAPHGLEIETQVAAGLWGEEAGDAMRLFAESGRFDVIWAHSTYSDQVAQLMAEFPDIMFVVVGSGNEGHGRNQYWVYKRVHEPAYLLGVLAGAATESDVIGVVGTFPADDVNDEINAFVEGARHANPEVEAKVAFIESWYDPAKAAEYMNAQIATGADLIFSIADNYAPCEEAGIVCIANFRDASALSGSVLSSPMADWTPDLEWIVDEWVRVASGEADYDGNTEPRWVPMAEGGSVVAPFHGREDMVPAKAMAAFEEARAEVASGALEVPLDVSTPISD